MMIVWRGLHLVKDANPRTAQFLSGGGGGGAKGEAWTKFFWGGAWEL